MDPCFLSSDLRSICNHTLKATKAFVADKWHFLAFRSTFWSEKPNTFHLLCNISSLLTGSKNTADLPVCVTLSVFTDCVPKQELWRVFSLCPLTLLQMSTVKISTISVDFQSLYYIFPNKCFVCHLQVLKKTLVVYLCYLSSLSGGKGVISDSGQSNCVLVTFVCGLSLTLQCLIN